MKIKIKPKTWASWTKSTSFRDPFWTNEPRAHSSCIDGVFNRHSSLILSRIAKRVLIFSFRTAFATGRLSLLKPTQEESSESQSVK